MSNSGFENHGAMAVSFGKEGVGTEPHGLGERECHSV